MKHESRRSVRCVSRTVPPSAPGGTWRPPCFYGIWTLVPLLVAGCGIGSARKSPHEIRARDLEQEKTQLAGQLEQCRIELEQVRRQAQALAALPPDEKENLFALTRVKISRFTDFYDKDEDGRKEKLIVYLQPIDQAGDVVKAVGSVSVQLWNLDAPAEQALLGQWQVGPDEISRLWFNTLTSTSYRLTFDAALPPEILARPLTVKATFTDYLSGGIFTAQYVIQSPIARGAEP